MTRSRLILPILLALAWLAPAAPAAAQDPQASASVSLADGPRLARGAHRLTVTWSAGCASAQPDLRPEIAIDIVPVLEHPRGCALSLASVQPEAAQGTAELTVPAGARVFAQIRVTCDRLEFVPDSGDPIEHIDRETARSDGSILIAPWIGHARLTGCGRLHLRSQWLVDSFVRDDGAKALRRAIRIRLRGAGLHEDIHPAKASRAFGEPLTAVIAPRRTGRLHVSASFGGVRSNTVSLRVRHVC